MKRYGKLWDKIISWENFVLAAKKAQRGKRGRDDVQRFNFGLEKELLILQQELIDGSYRPGRFRSHWIYRPKARLISAAPYRDRVVHHALMNILEPILDRHFHFDSYACRKDKGTHAAANRLQQLMRRHKYALQCDIRKYFPTIDHQILKRTFRRLIKDKKLLWLTDLIVDYSNKQEKVLYWFDGDDLFTPIERAKGLPIGNLTSQWFANWYLNSLDHFITGKLGISGYVRYCDDFILLDNDRDVLKDARRKITNHLQQLRMCAHECKLSVKPVRAGLPFVGYRIWPTHKLIRKVNVKGFCRRVKWMKKAYTSGVIGWEDIKIRLDSWIGHAKQADSIHLMKRLSKEWKFTRDGTVSSPCSSRRVLEQQSEELPNSESQQEHARQHEQQHRVSGCRHALSNALHKALNRTVYGLCERGIESPGFIPEPLAEKTGGQIYVVWPDRTGRSKPERPIWSNINFSELGDAA